jgi:hypothetical protein
VVVDEAKAPGLGPILARGQTTEQPGAFCALELLLLPSGALFPGRRLHP